MDWFLYDNGLRHERVKEKTRVVSEHANIVILWLSSLDLPKISKRYTDNFKRPSSLASFHFPF